MKRLCLVLFALMTLITAFTAFPKPVDNINFDVLLKFQNDQKTKYYWVDKPLFIPEEKEVIITPL